MAGAYSIRIDRIRPDPGQPRQSRDEKADQQLATSIRQLGILQPITVRYLADEKIYQIISGERRYQAALSAGLEEIPCWVQTPKDKDILLHQVVENWQRVDLHPFDLADTLVLLRDQQHYTQKEIAELTGKPESEISKILSLLKINPALQQQYRQDKTALLSRRHLESIAKLPEADQVSFHVQVQQQGLTAKETEQLVQQTLRPKETTKKNDSPFGTKRKIVTPKGVVYVVLRRKDVELNDILEVLDLAKKRVQEEGC